MRLFFCGAKGLTGSVGSSEQLINWSDSTLSSSICQSPLWISLNPQAREELGQLKETREREDWSSEVVDNGDVSPIRPVARYGEGSRVGSLEDHGVLACDSPRFQ